MFLVNAPPVAAFQTQWTPFGLNATHRVSESLSQPEKTPDLPIATNLQGLLDIQENNAPSRSVTVEYEHIMQWNSEGELKIDRGLKSRGTRFKGHPKEEATIIVPPQFKDIKGECSGLGTLALDSDSDDSVDRGIEEAIQEYLKNRGDKAPTSEVVKLPSPAKSDSDKLKAVQKNVPVRKNPTKMVASNATAFTFLPQSQARCSSSDSADSDDSFEQSINDEIEQFLLEKKRLQNNGKEAAAVAKNPARNHTPVKPKQHVTKAVEKQSPKQGMKGLAGKPLSEMTRPRNPPKPKTDSSKASLCLKPLPEPWKRPELQAFPSGQREELSDSSSSDDGIEEAIQLYQLERSRLGGTLNAASVISPQKDSKTAVIPTPSLGHCPNKKSSPGSPKKTEYRKRKLSNSKASSSSSSSSSSQDSTGCHPLISKRTFISGDDQNPPSGFPLQATRRAETAAELMCAEAILDISKAILPSKPESTLTVSQETPSAQPAVSSSSSDSSVDSDDSIEQEIRTFLAHKALAESLGAATAKPPLSKKTRLKQGKPQALSSSKPPKEKPPENVTQKDSTGNGGQLEKRPLNVDTGVANATMTPNESKLDKSKKICMAERTNLQCQSVAQVVQAVELLESSPTLGVGKRKMYVKTRSLNSGDKSSSLDSDEDLDSAIKDLLRSKRKYKKRAKDGRPQCKKKVRFDETSAKPLETVLAGGGKRNFGNSKSSLVRNNLLSSSNLKENLKSKTEVKLKDVKQSLVGSEDLSTSKVKPACASDKPVTLDSAFGDPQDSSPVDSDDSTEQEIRKFLAERARASAELSAAQKPTVVLPNADVTKDAAPPASVKNPPSLKHEPKILSQSVTETILQKVRETARSVAPKQATIQRVCGYKDNPTPLAQLRQQPTDASKAPTPLRSVIVKRGCVVEQNQIMRPTESSPEAVLLQTDVNGSPTNLPVSGNFVAGLTYISGTEQQLLLSIAKTGATRVAAEMYNPVGAIAQLGSCPSVQKKTLILEQPQIVQAPAFSLGAPLVRPALYVVTTKVVQDPSGSFCLPMNTASYDGGLNLMRIQYCHSQVASPTSTCTNPFSAQSTSTDSLGSSPGQAGEVQVLTNKARDVLESNSRSGNVTETAADPCSNVTSESSVQTDEV